MYSRQRSCMACFRAKRRCEPEHPACVRCSKLGLRCVYRNEPLLRASKPSRTNASSPVPASPGVWSRRDVTGFIEDLELFNLPQDTLSLPGLLPPLVPTAHMDAWSLNQVVRQVKSWPGMFLHTLSTPFIHPSLHRPGGPLDDAFSACATYAARNPQTATTALRVVETCTNRILALGDTSLASLQAILILQTIQLFNGDIRARALAEQNWASVLEPWVEQILLRPESHADNWIEAESVRRTALATVFVQGAFEGIKLGGSCTRVWRMAPMLFTPGAGRWWRAGQAEGPRERSAKEGIRLVAYERFAADWRSKCLPSPEPGRSQGEAAELDTWEKLLLTPCCGEAYRSWLTIEDE